MSVINPLGLVQEMLETLLQFYDIMGQVMFYYFSCISSGFDGLIYNLVREEKS